MEYKIQPWHHQLEAIERAKDQPGFALLMDVGTGKTSTLINILRHKYNAHKKVLPTLILCPPIVLDNWRREWLAHSSIQPEKLVILSGSGKDRLKLFEESDKSSVFITNYESLLMKDLYAAFQEWGPDVVVADESQRLKSHTASRTKLAIQLANGKKTKHGEVVFKAAKYRYIMTGTPILNSPMDLFTQYLFMDGGQTFGDNFFGFRARYMIDRNAGMPRDKYFPNWQIRNGALEEINRKLFNRGMHVKKQDCLDLPPFITTTIRVGMTPEQIRLYAEMKRDFLTSLNDEAITATLAITKALRLMQITSGFVKTEDGKVIELENTPKLKALQELLTELAPDHKIIIWATWGANYAQIRLLCDLLNLQYVELTGETSANKRQANVDTFNNDEKCRVLIGHPGAAGIGVNLIASDISIFYSRTFSLEHSLQAEARNYRGGSERHQSVTRYDLVVENTIDEAVVQKLSGKLEVSLKILKDIV